MINPKYSLAAAAVLAAAVVSAGSAGAATAPAGPVMVSNEHTVSYYANTQAAAVVYAQPATTGVSLGKLRFLTDNGQVQVYLVLESQLVSGTLWYEVRLPTSPNNTTGWVQATALSALRPVYGYLLINRLTLRATLFDRSDHKVWSAPIGIGQSGYATPTGNFYVQEKETNQGGKAFGPYGIGLTAYVAHGSNWPGGKLIGIHGTDLPDSSLAKPSKDACVRMSNANVTKLYARIAIGTPVQIS